MRDTAHDNFFEVQKIIKSQYDGVENQEDNKDDLFATANDLTVKSFSIQTDENLMLQT